MEDEDDAVVVGPEVLEVLFELRELVITALEDGTGFALEAELEESQEGDEGDQGEEGDEESPVPEKEVGIVRGKASPRWVLVGSGGQNTRSSS